MTIREFRKCYGLSQAQFADIVCLPSGKRLNRSAVSHYECGRRAPTALWHGVAESISLASYCYARRKLRRIPTPQEYVEFGVLIGQGGKNHDTRYGVGLLHTPSRQGDGRDLP